MTAVEADVTVVVVPRERFGAAPESLDSVIDRAGMQFRLVYVDGRPPRPVRRALGQRLALADVDVEVVHTPALLPPNQSRQLAVPFIDTRYVAFVDNDVLVQEGWLRHLVDCAEQTGAVIVGPLYLEGDDDVHVVHMAGGAWTITGAPGARIFRERHIDIRREVDLASYQRRRVDFVEMHCVLVRAAFLRKLGGFDTQLITREHLDLCLAAADQGESVWIEPRSVALFGYDVKLQRGDLLRSWRRWSEPAVARSLERFYRKWGFAVDQPRFDPATFRRRRLGPVRSLLVRVLPERWWKAVRRPLRRVERSLNRRLFE